MDLDDSLDRFDSRRSTVYSNNGVVATSHPLAAQAGIDILRRGGNAFDAAVATAAALNVVEPPSTGIGGDVFALYRTEDGDVGGLNSCGGAPAEATLERTREAVADAGASTEPTMPASGPYCVTVPGAARGWEATVDSLGELSFTEVLQPAIEYATEGHPVTEILAHLWKLGEEKLTDASARDEYLVDGRAPKVGETITHPTLGETLQTVAEYGADAFYEGEIAERIVDAVQSKGGFLTGEDLSGFEPEFIEPIETTYHGATVYQLPPSTQGAIVLEALNIAEELGTDEYSLGTAKREHYLIESMKLAFHDGHSHITDPEYYDVPPIQTKEYAKKRAKLIDETARITIDSGYPLADASDTVLLTVADTDGNVVSFINSLYGAFGSGIVPEGTGTCLHSRGASFSLDPDHPNCIEPKKRPFHTLIPGLLQFSEDDWLAYGVMGAFMQPQGHLQVVSDLVDGEVSIQQVLDKPRWRYLESGDVAIEGRFDDDVVSELARRGHELSVYPSGLYIGGPVGGFGGGQIARYDDGTLSAATDPRKDGAALGY